MKEKMKISHIRDTPQMIGIKERTISPPPKGWGAHTWYIVEVAFDSTNVIHKALFYSGFVNEGRPGGYNCLFHPSYDRKFELDEAYYLTVISEIPKEILDIM